MPKKDCSSLTFYGFRASWIVQTFSTVGCNPSLSMTRPRYSIWERRKKHLDLFSFNPEFCSSSSTVFKSCRWLCKVGPVIRILSMYTDTPLIPCSRFSIVHWKIDGVDGTPKGRQLYLYKLLCVFTMTYSFDSLSKGNCRCACDRSNFEKFWPPSKFASSLSTLGSVVRNLQKQLSLK